MLWQYLCCGIPRMPRTQRRKSWKDRNPSRQLPEESSFSTWCYRIATNHLLTTRKRRAERMDFTFEKFEEDIPSGLAYSQSHATPPKRNAGFLVEELMIGCTQGMLLCPRPDPPRYYILGEILEVNSREGGSILDITPRPFANVFPEHALCLRDFAAYALRMPRIPQTLVSAAGNYRIPSRPELVNPQKLLFAGHQRRDIVVSPLRLFERSE